MYDDSATIDLDNVPLHGRLLIKSVALSIDPYMRLLLVGPEVKTAPFDVSRVTPLLIPYL